MSRLPFLPDKSLGQNFLLDKNYLQKIVANCPIDSNTIIMEIGSGYGHLTKELAATNCLKVFSWEKDLKLFQWLMINNNSEKIIFFHGDALQINWSSFCAPYQNNSLIVVGNLPYYLANSLIVNLLFNYQLFNYLIFLVQREVAHRWVGKKSEYSALSVFINYLSVAELVFIVPSTVFVPSPEVEGGVVKIKIKHENNLSSKQLSNFLNFLKNCFRFRRKTLLNNLLSFAGNQKNDWENYFQNHNYSWKIRPHNLNSTDYWRLFTYWQSL